VTGRNGGVQGSSVVALSGIEVLMMSDGIVLKSVTWKLRLQNPLVFGDVISSVS
jgi:hypothetical protein